MTTAPASPFVFDGVETPPDPVDGAIADALQVALAAGGAGLADARATIDVAELGRALRAELRRMDIEAILVTRLDPARRRFDLVALSAYTLALAQRNAALREIERLTAGLEAGHALAADLRREIDGLAVTEGR
jgi:hypothetical protein